MPKQRHKVVGLGEILWDMLPSGKQLGGAPSNFAYISSLFGNEGIVASRVGDDALGAEAERRLTELQVTTAFLQRDTEHPTGTVRVELDPGGQPKFEIAGNVAWDFLDWTADWNRLAGEANAICFGSLAQRSPSTRSTIHQFLQAAGKEAVRIFDVNLRQSFFTAEIIRQSMKAADIVKLNHEELPRIMQLFELDHRDDIGSADALLEKYSLKLICVTRGCHGSLLISQTGLDEHPGFRIQVADAIGAGDAFTAGLVHEYLRGSSLPAMNEAANRVGAWVATQVGAMPAPRGEHGIRGEMAGIG